MGCAHYGQLMQHFSFIYMKFGRISSLAIFRDPREGFRSLGHLIVSWKTIIIIEINWASSRENLSSGCPTKPVSNQSPQLQRLARKLKFCL